jgi:hypothetical protein
MRPLVLLLLLALLAAAAPPAVAPVAPPEHRRPADQTFLTVPEWYLVGSPEEYAGYLADRDPSRFPFMGHLGQFWQSYAAVSREVEPFPANAGYHLMIVVIGTSTTVEYGLKSLYEQLIGRFTELVAGGPNTSEDRLAARVAADYVTFIKVRPWYEFDFLTPLRQLWTETGLWGPHPLRKWERKYILTSEYLVKAGYAWLLERAAHATYETPIDTTHVVAAMPGAAPAARMLPRYQAFTDASMSVAQAGGDFAEIAGNRGPILVTVLAGPGWQPPGKARLLLAQPVLTRPGQSRYVVSSDVADLADLLRSLDPATTRVEHVYDY